MTKQITGTYFVWNYSMTVSHIIVSRNPFHSCYVHIFVLWLGFPFNKRSLFSSWNPRATCDMDCTIPVLSRGITIACTCPVWLNLFHYRNLTPKGRKVLKFLRHGYDWMIFGGILNCQFRDFSLEFFLGGII